MKVGIKWKGEELKYVDVDDLTLENGITLGKYIESVAGEISGLKSIIASQAGIITNMQTDIANTKLENLKIVEGLLRR